MIFIRNGGFNYESNRVAVSGTTCRLAHLPRCIMLEQSVGVGASNARRYRYCSFLLLLSSFSLVLHFTRRLSHFLLQQSTRVMLFSHFEPLGPPVASRSLCSFARRFRCISKQVPRETLFKLPIFKTLHPKTLEFKWINTRRALKTRDSTYRNLRKSNTYEGQTQEWELKELNELG